jgi:hypothetical protein
MSDELKPCPFCGATALWTVPCEHGSGMFGIDGAHKPGCMIGCIDFADFCTPELATEVWNRRPAQPATPAPDMAGEVERLDASRYRWLRDHSCPPHNFYVSVPDEFHGVRYAPVDVDAYIDEAIAALWMTAIMTDMPNPIPEALKEAARQYVNIDRQGLGLAKYGSAAQYFRVSPAGATAIARLLWKGGWREPVDPDVEAVERMLKEWLGQHYHGGVDGPGFDRALAVYKDLRELERQGNDG